MWHIGVVSVSKYCRNFSSYLMKNIRYGHFLQEASPNSTAIRILKYYDPPNELAFTKSILVAIIVILMFTVHIYLYNILKLVEEKDIKDGTICGVSKKKDERDVEVGPSSEAKDPSNASDINSNNNNNATPETGQEAQPVGVRYTPSMAPRQFWSTRSRQPQSPQVPRVPKQTKAKPKNVQIFYFQA